MIDTGMAQDELLNGFKSLLTITLKREIENTFQGNFIAFAEQGINNLPKDALALIKGARLALGDSIETQKNIVDTIQTVFINLDIEYNIKALYCQQAALFDSTAQA